MKNILEQLILSILTLLFASSAMAGVVGNGGGWSPPSASVPIDSPWLLAGLSVLLAITALRILRKR
jgi:hypothetical protein